MSKNRVSRRALRRVLLLTGYLTAGYREAVGAIPRMKRPGSFCGAGSRAVSVVSGARITAPWAKECPELRIPVKPNLFRTITIYF
jgi:hypothetical protein